MEVTSFFSRLLRPPTLVRRASSRPQEDVPLDDVEAFERAWTVIQAVLLEPDERQLLRGIQSTDVPRQLERIVQGLVYEHEAGEQGAPTGGCLEYFLNEGMLRHLVELSEDDRPFGVRAEVLKSINHLLLLLPDSFIVHASVHRPLLQLIRSSIDDGVGGQAGGRTPSVGAAAADERDVGGFGRAENEVEREGRLVDLLSIVCAKLRASPLLLLILFHDRVSSANPATVRHALPRSTSSRSLGQDHLDHLIFPFLLRYVHYDGRLGECARLGAECLLDIAFGAEDLPGAQAGASCEISAEGDDTLHRAKQSLAEQIVEGDGADVLAAGLGAVYSVLPFKIRLPRSDEGGADEGGMRLGGDPEDVGHNTGDTVLQTVRDATVEDQLKMLLEVWTFVNGVLARCQRAADGETMADESTRSIAARVGQQIRTSIRLSFLDNVLYPSILECSTTDGSAVAVLSYLRVLLRLDDVAECKEPLGQYILAYLLGFDVSESETEGLPGGSTGPLTTRFTLKDLLMDAIGSSSTEAGTAALGLLSGLLDGHCSLTSTGLLSAERGQQLTAFARDSAVLETQQDANDNNGASAGAEFSSPETNSSEDGRLPIDELAAAFSSKQAKRATLNLDSLKRQMIVHPDVKLYEAVLAQISRDAYTSGETSWHAYVKDSYGSLSRHNCFKAGLAGGGGASAGHGQASLAATQADSWMLHPGDKVLQELLTMLRHLFSHTAVFNVALTAALSSIAICPRCSLSGWSLRSSLFTSESSNLGGASVSAAADYPFEAAGEDRLPILYVTLRELAKQITVYRSRITGFDRHLGERRQGLLYVEGMQDAMNVMLDVVPTQTARPDWTPQREPAPGTDDSPRRTRGLSSSLLSFLTPRKKASHGASSSISNSPFSFLAEEQDSSSPHAAHYRKTTSVNLDPLTAAEPARSAWTPESTAPAAAPEAHSRNMSESEATSDDLFAPVRTTFNANLPEAPCKVSLSSILDNCVILEEFIKETIGHIVARQTLGIDEL